MKCGAFRPALLRIFENRINVFAKAARQSGNARMPQTDFTGQKHILLKKRLQPSTDASVFIYLMVKGVASASAYIDAARSACVF